MRKKVRIVILNYNGSALLKKYLPSVLIAAKRSGHNCSVAVIDNKSTDDSIDFLGQFRDEIEIYNAKKNKVLCSYNDYLETIDDDIVIFLNTDIKVDADFVDPLIKHFEDEDVLFVAPKELDMNGRYQGNLNKIIFRLGILATVVNKKDHDKKQHDISVHGGAFDRKKFLFLKGYDDMYLPGIVEDLDLCYRGWKYGWKGIYEPESFYFHEGSTSFSAKHGQSGKALLAHRNAFLFFWKNVTSKRLIFLHIISIPLLLCVSLLRARWLVIRGFFQALGMIHIAVKRKAAVAMQFRISDQELIRRVNSPF